MRVLVTGSEGFIGKNLCHALKREGHEVEEWDVKAAPYLDVTNFDPYRYFNRDIDVIYHLACINQMQATKHPEANLYVNSLATQNLANLAAKIRAKFIYTSTASVYGNATQIPTPVSAKLAPLTDYAVAKLAGEFFVQNSGADYTILRLSNVYGPHQTLDNPYCGVIGRFITQALAGEQMTVIGDGMQTRDFSYVDDVVEHIYRAGLPEWYCSPTSGQILNVSSGVETSVTRLAKYINWETGASYELGTNKRPIDGVQRRLLKPDLVCSTPLQVGIFKTIQWFKEQQALES